MLIGLFRVGFRIQIENKNFIQFLVADDDFAFLEISIRYKSSLLNIGMPEPPPLPSGV